MDCKFPEYKALDLSKINKDVLADWQKENTFEQSLKTREGHPQFIFYEGPPSANGKPGIHHVISRTLKDLFCRYKTLKGFHVARRAGWDTHGLPVELGVERSLGITKEDIGKTISVEEYNIACRKDVMKFTDLWEDITGRIGYWLDMENAYITYDNKYIETLWYLLKQLYNKDLLYKGHTIQPYSPAAGTGLSSHELNQPGCYRDVKDTTCIAQFKAVRNEKSEFLFQDVDTDVYFLAWTTTPWTLLSNVALAVGKNITYLKIRTFNPYTGIPVTIIMAKDLYQYLFGENAKDLKLEDYKPHDKHVPFEIKAEFDGAALEGISYEQLLPYHQPTDGDAFKVICGDFVTTTDGTGIVHIAPSFGADDYRVGKQYGMGTLTLVDRQGKFVDGCGVFSGLYVKNAYDSKLTESDLSVDVLITLKLKQENKTFKIEKHVHSYPHCWRTQKPVLYYPLDSWFIRTTSKKDRMIELNNTINWQPSSTGSGRFGKWLENLVDWNLSRSRYWGTPLPIWVTEDRSEEICIGSLEELKAEIEKSVTAGFMTEDPLKDFVVGDFSKVNYNKIDLHRPYVDNIVLVSSTGKKMFREPDLIDVWFDSGAMPYAQLHYPFENKEKFEEHFPANFIAEGVDQTRGWFFTLHALGTMLFDSVAFKSVISTGLVLDKNGVKMSKSLGNTIDPFEMVEKYGSDAVRWYMITNSQPWDNLKFDPDGVDEVRRKFFGTLYNTYSFFSLYANVDGFRYQEKDVPVGKRPEIDRWIISLLNTLVKNVEEAYENLEPTKAGRLIQDFVIDHLSNWYVRLNRKRFWGGEFDEDKMAAYQTLYTCLETVAILAAPIAPFFSDRLFTDLNNLTGRHDVDSVHLADFPVCNTKLVDKALEERMDIAQRISSMVLALRRKVSLKVRQPLSKIMVPVLEEGLQKKMEAVENIILTEVNIKSIEYLSSTLGVLVKKIKPNFKTLGPKYSKLMKQISAAISAFSQQEIADFEKNGSYKLVINDQEVVLSPEDAEIISEDIPGWLVTNDGNLTVALDITVTESLKQEGIAREFINRIQNQRKDMGLDVTDKIGLEIMNHEAINVAVQNFSDYISSQTLSQKIELVEKLDESIDGTKFVEIDTDISTFIRVIKL
jgi:isoleucyl-tRNA synthetase